MRKQIHGVAIAAAFAMGISVVAVGQCIDGDVNGDGVVNGIDLSVVLTNWGQTCPVIITAVTPASGPPTGGTTITITGQQLGGVQSVTIGGVPATNIIGVDAMTITALTPPSKTLGPKDVVVTTTNGTAALPGGFGYAHIDWGTVLEFEPDPTIVTDPEWRSRILATGLPWRVRDDASGIEMLLVPPGTFRMGCSPSLQTACVNDESPVREVTLTAGFYMGRYEVTQAEWTAVMGSNPSVFQGAADSPNRPVEKVSWNMIQGFEAATGLRLPTEAEWEYACRAGTETAFNLPPNGTNDENLLGQIAWYAANSGGQTHAVGQKQANSLGLHDMHGNVYEWVEDWYTPAYYSWGENIDPTGPAGGTTRVLRGYSWINAAGNLRVSRRESSFTPGDTGAGYLGFRVVRTPEVDADRDGYPPDVDCDDADPFVNPGAQEICGNGVDDDCDGLIDCEDLDCAKAEGCVQPLDWATVIQFAPDPAVVTDHEWRERIIATGLPWRVRDNASQIEMVLVPSGTFIMGCSASQSSGCDSNSVPAHGVTLTQAFYLGRYEVTQAQWTEVMGANPSYFVAPSTEVPPAQVPSRPVEQVSWNMIQDFEAATGLRLPSEAEWEYACRAGTQTSYNMPPDGTNESSQLGLLAWVSGNSLEQTRPVGQKLANNLGLHDMHGNVWEWVEDWYGESYYSESPAVDPPGPTSGTLRVLRGGSWLGSGATAYLRVQGNPYFQESFRGFRVARTP